MPSHDLFRGSLIGAGLVLLGVVLVMSLFTALTIGRPIAALVRQTQRAVRGEPGAVRTLTAKDSGGLGLALAVSLVNSHGSSLSLEDTDAGATFVVTVPSAQS